MKEEHKKMLLSYLCAMYPYKVICEMHTNGSSETITEELHIGGLAAFENGTLEIKPYIRPLSSMTKEEEKELCGWLGAKVYFGHISFPLTDRFGEDNFIYEAHWARVFEWLKSRHFEYLKDEDGNTMTELGLALVAPKGMYDN